VNTLASIFAAIGAGCVVCGISLIFPSTEDSTTHKIATWILAIGLGLLAVGVVIWLSAIPAECYLHSACG